MRAEIVPTTHQVDRRNLLRTGLLVGLGIGVVGAASPLLTGRALAEPAAAAASGDQQSGWKWCVKCQGLFYGVDSAHVSASKCPAGSSHSTSGSGTYIMFFLGSVIFLGDPQPGWKWCVRCQGLFYGPDSAHVSASKCPAGGSHTNGATDYVMFAPGGQPGQTGWKYCSKCQGAFFGVDSAHVLASKCPGRQHPHHQQQRDVRCRNGLAKGLYTD